MISKSKTSLIASLQKKKTRDEVGLYVIEGDKIVREYLMDRIPLKILVANTGFIKSLPPDNKEFIDEIIPVEQEDLKKISSLKTPHNALAVVRMGKVIQEEIKFNGLCAALDSIQDPGNMGTIIRAAAWFGIKKIFCSKECVDPYNPKVIQASMGAVLRVDVRYADLKNLLSEAVAEGNNIYGAVLEGESIYKHKLNKKGIILLGNESRGINVELEEYISDRIMIPFHGKNTCPGIDSLNVGMAASIIFSEFSRR